MKFEKLVSSSAAVALALGLAVSAKAKVVTATYQGTVSSGYDQLGLFGAAGSDMAGASFTAAFTINDGLAAESGAGPDFSSAIGGSEFGLPSPVNGSITINGDTVEAPGDYFDLMALSIITPDHDQTSIRNETQASGAKFWSYLSFSIFNSTNDISPSADYHTPFSYTVQPDDSVSGIFTAGSHSDSCDSYTDTCLNLAPTSVTLADVADVPEPATWVMLILGAGAIGFAARRRKVGRHMRRSRRPERCRNDAMRLRPTPPSRPVR